MEAQFLLLVVAVTLFVAFAIFRWLPPTYRLPGLIGLTLWLTYGGAVGFSGLAARSQSLPPGLFFLLAPTILLVMFLARSNAGRVVALSFPLWLLTGMESLRLAVEGFLHLLWLEGRLPTMLTYHGANFDIVIGGSAPVVAWLIASRRISDRAALAWHIAGIGMLANVAVRAVLTTPGPLNLIATEVPNLAIISFPFTYIPGLMVPFALALHVLSIRAIRERSKHTARTYRSHNTFIDL